MSHSPEYVVKIKALIKAKEATELELKRALYAFRNGYPVNPAVIESAKYHFEQVIAILEGTNE